MLKIFTRRQNCRFTRFLLFVSVLRNCGGLRTSKPYISVVFVYPVLHRSLPGHLPIWKEVKFIDRDPNWYTRRVKEAIHIRLHPNNINRDSGIEIPEAWIPTIRKHNSRPTTKRTCEGTTSDSWNNNEDRNAPIAANLMLQIATRKQSTSSPDED